MRIDATTLSILVGSRAWKDGGEIRQLIFHPDGHLRYDWAKQGAIIL